MFSLTLTEIDDKPPLFVIDPGKMPPESELTATENIKLHRGTAAQIPSAEPFQHFCHNFRELPAQKIQQIIAIITKPERLPRSDRGKKRKQDSTPMLPGARA